MVASAPGDGGRGTAGTGAPARWAPEAPERPAGPPGQAMRRVLLGLAVVLLFAVCGLLTLSAVAGATGATGLAVGVALAAVPVLPVLAAFLWLDRYEAEPVPLLLFALGWGAAVATLVSLLLNTASVAALQAGGGDPDAVAVLVAPVVEESAKGMAVLGVLALRRREFDGVVDGIVYAGLAGLGFAFVENVLYLGRTFMETGGGGTAVVFVLRCLFSPFAHPLFTMAIGVGVGLAVSRRGRAWRLAPVLGWVVAVALHGAWNLAAVSGIDGFVTGYVLVQVPVFLAAVLLALLARRREGRLVREHLGLYAASGWLTPAEVTMLGSLPERGAARGWAERTAGRDGARAMRSFQELGTELAFLRHRMQHGTAAPDAPSTELRLLQTMWQLRTRFLPHRAGVG